MTEGAPVQAVLPHPPLGRRAPGPVGTALTGCHVCRANFNSSVASSVVSHSDSKTKLVWCLSCVELLIGWTEGDSG
jgi:hypothetical protein